MALIELTANDDTFTDTDDANEILGLAGADIINGEGGDDIIRGGDGNDRLTGGNGDDTLYGDEDNDIFFAANGADIYYGGNGNDFVSYNDFAVLADLIVGQGGTAETGTDTIFQY